MTELGSSKDTPGVPSHPRTFGEVDDSTDRDEQLSAKSERLRSFMRTGGEVVGQVAGVAVSGVAGPVVGGVQVPCSATSSRGLVSNFTIACWHRGKVLGQRAL
jgi:hypothetical protein